MNNSQKSLFKKTLICSAGLIMFGFGIYLSIQANIGIQPWDVFCLSLSERLGIIYGNASIAISVILIIVDILMGEKIGLGTILDAVIVGKTVDFFNWLGLVPKIEGNALLSVAVLLVSFAIEGFSQYYYLKAGLSAGSRDSFQITLGRRMPVIPIGVVNIFILLAVLLIGIALGGLGYVGIGTAIAPFGLGILQQISFNIMKFDPKTVTHQGLLESVKIIFRKENK